MKRIVEVLKRAPEIKNGYRFIRTTFYEPGAIARFFGRKPSSIVQELLVVKSFSEWFWYPQIKETSFYWWEKLYDLNKEREVRLSIYGEE